jgi:hypothetical protein
VKHNGWPCPTKVSCGTAPLRLWITARQARDPGRRTLASGRPVPGSGSRQRPRTAETRVGRPRTGVITDHDDRALGGSCAPAADQYHSQSVSATEPNVTPDRRLGADESCGRCADLRLQIIWIWTASVMVGQFRCAATQSPHRHPWQDLLGPRRLVVRPLLGGVVGYVRDVCLHPGGSGAGPRAGHRTAAATAILCLIQRGCT